MGEPLTTVGRMGLGAGLPASPVEDAARRTAYESLLRGDHRDGPRGRVVMCVYTDDLAEGRGDVYVAAGLGLALVELGFGVELVPRRHWHLIESADVFVALLPDVDPSLAPRGAWKVAWVRNETDRWAASSHLVAFDQVMASSQIALTRLRRATPRASGVVRIGVDTDLFRPSPDGSPRSRTAVTTANFWGGTRDVHRALMELPDDADVAMYGQAKGAPQELLRWHRPAISYFAIPDVYRRAGIVIDDMNTSTVGYGTLNSRFFESAACGSLPLVNGLLGVDEIGLPGVPRYTGPSSLVERLRELRADPDDVAARAARLQQRVSSDHSWKVRAEQFVDALDKGRASSAPAPPSTALHFFPDYSENPYQSMLNAGLAEVDAYPTPVKHLHTHLRLREERGGHPGVLHLHWTNPIVQWAEGPFQARRALTTFLGALDRFLDNGGRLIWTIHNVLPHDTRFRWAEVELAQALADRAELVHVLSAATLDEVRGSYELDPDKVVVVEHSSFAGRYPQWVTRGAARTQLGILPSEKVLVAVGGIRPYKGLDVLLDALDVLEAEDPTVRLIIAGKAGHYPAVERLRERCKAHPRVIAVFEHVPDDHLQLWMKAADVAVLPYRNILNSSVFMLTQTFGLPVVAPNIGALRHWEGEEHVRLFDPSKPGDLLAVVRGFLTDVTSDPEIAARIRQSSLSAAAARPPEAMADAFATAIAPALRGADT